MTYHASSCTYIADAVVGLLLLTDLKYKTKHNKYTFTKTLTPSKTLGFFTICLHLLQATGLWTYLARKKTWCEGWRDH